jgi:hypothetical protein
MQVRVDTTNFEPGLRAMEAIGARAAAELGEVELVEYPRDDDFEAAAGTIETLRRRRGPGFRRFVTLLERYGREGVRDVMLSLIHFARGYDEDDQARLFGEVLPRLPLLERMVLDSCDSYEANLELFASRLSVTSSLVELEIQECFGDFSVCAPALAGMVRRNVPLQVLKLKPAERLDKDACRHIFSSLQDNSNLRRLEAWVEEVYDEHDVPILPSGPNSRSSLRRLDLDVKKWTDEGKSSLARQLRTNTGLEKLVVEYFATKIRVRQRPWVEVLESHNYTLRVLRERNRNWEARARRLRDGRVFACLRRNERIRQALHDLREYHVSPAVLLPRVLEMVSGLPTLLYRFVRLGDVNTLGDLLLVARRRPRHRRRGRDAAKKKRSCPAPLRRSVRLAGLPPSESRRRVSRRTHHAGPLPSGL